MLKFVAESCKVFAYVHIFYYYILAFFLTLRIPFILSTLIGEHPFKYRDWGLSTSDSLWVFTFCLHHAKPGSSGEVWLSVWGRSYLRHGFTLHSFCDPGWSQTWDSLASDYPDLRLQALDTAPSSGSSSGTYITVWEEHEAYKVYMNVRKISNTSESVVYQHHNGFV